MNHSEEISEIAKAICSAQAQMGKIKKDGKNPHFRSKYSTIDEVLEAAIPVLTANNIATIQTPSFDGSLVSLETRLIHSSGQFISDILSAPLKKDTSQEIGSCITYLRRYSLQSFLGLSAEDDDAEATMGRGRQAPAPKQSPSQFEVLSKMQERSLKAKTAAELNAIISDAKNFPANAKKDVFSMLSSVATQINCEFDKESKSFVSRAGGDA